MKSPARLAALVFGFILLAASLAPAATAGGDREVQGRIVAQELTGGQGYTVLHVWGSHHEMGYAQGYLLADFVQLYYQELIAVFGAQWPLARAMAAGWTFRPTVCEEELQGILDGVLAHYPGTPMDVLDLKTACTFGDWAYSIACRSTACWGSLPAAPHEFLSVRKLQFPLLPASITQQWHHVITAWEPADGSPHWVNCGLPAQVSAVTAVNEYGTVASLHDWNSSYGPDIPDALPRTMACRHALTLESLGPDPQTHLTAAFAELGQYDVATGGFLNYYAPAGGAGVIKTSKSLGFYDVRLPQPEWMNAEVISTNNSDIDGRSGIAPWVSYYTSLDPEQGIRATLGGLWDTGYQAGDLHMLATGYRARRDMTLWFSARLQAGVLPRLELEWSDLFNQPGTLPDNSSPAVFTQLIFPNPARRGAGAVTILCSSPPGHRLPGVAILDPSGRCVRRLTKPFACREGNQLLFHWDGRDTYGRPVSAGTYYCGLRSGAARPLVILGN